MGRGEKKGTKLVDVAKIVLSRQITAIKCLY
jgi:hypothetical protein